jgi:hypothetical protein
LQDTLINLDSGFDLSRKLDTWKRQVTWTLANDAITAEGDPSHVPETSYTTNTREAVLAHRANELDLLV